MQVSVLSSVLIKSRMRRQRKLKVVAWDCGAEHVGRKSSKSHMKLIRESSILVLLITNVTTYFLSPEIGAVAEVLKTMVPFHETVLFL